MSVWLDLVEIAMFMRNIRNDRSQSFIFCSEASSTSRYQQSLLRLSMSQDRVDPTIETRNMRLVLCVTLRYNALSSEFPAHAVSSYLIFRGSVFTGYSECDGPETVPQHDGLAHVV